ncbi:MAG: hypothetical protein BJ554DRAFT_6547 [Olpidium bornovanus]|uniref:Profilin n=1 Tax=Olpidium bornovanus TaxID=278681 RepID=A0A8H7ZXQ0_9FUNG|nr:MAG: hypothetical protein BJ554DRAFT_6547 [Olpidium bornovanus]
MSWQSYVDDNLVGTGKIEKAAIHGNPDKASWATSPGFTVACYIIAASCELSTTCAWLLAALLFSVPFLASTFTFGSRARIFRPLVPPAVLLAVRAGGADLLCSDERTPQLSSTELDALLKALTDPSGIRANGLHLGGVKFAKLERPVDAYFSVWRAGSVVLSCSGRCRVRRVADGCPPAFFCSRCDSSSKYQTRQGACGVICVKTNKAILVATYNEKTQPGEAAKVVEALGDYLINAGYVSFAFFEVI